MSQKTYRIGEAAAKLNLKGYVLRFWETEFSQIAPLRTEKGQRLYTESDLAMLSRIRYLLHERGLTIDGARRLLREEADKGAPHTNADILADDGFTGEDAPDESGNGTQTAFGAGFEDTLGQEDDGSVPEKIAARHPAAMGPEQASLFSPKTGRAVMNQTELHGIVAELEAIRRLLIYDGEIQ